MTEKRSMSSIIARILYVVIGILAITVMLVAWANVNPIATIAVISIMALPVLGTWIYMNRRNQRLNRAK